MYVFFFSFLFLSLICVFVIFRIWFVTFRNETVRKFSFQDFRFIFSVAFLLSFPRISWQPNRYLLGFTWESKIQGREFWFVQDEIGCCTSLRATGALANEEASSLGSLRARKQRKITTEANQSEKGQEEPRSTAIINSLKRLQNDIGIDGQDAAATVLKLSRDQSR